MKKFLKMFTLPITQLVLIYLLELVLTLFMLFYLREKIAENTYWFNFVLNALRSISFIMFFYVIFNQKMEQAYKINWILMFLISPSLGGLLYVFFAKSKFFPKKYQKYYKLRKKYKNNSILKESSCSVQNKEKLINEAPRIVKLSNYISTVNQTNLNDSCESYFFYSKEKAWDDIILEIENAKKSVFLEFFIINEGWLLDKIVEILIQKSKEGVDIKILYDAFGSFGKIKRKTIRELKKANINIRSFNKVKFHIDSLLNYRNHKKNIIIDDSIVYIGGANLSDEYADIHNKNLKYWFDSIIKLKGKVVDDFIKLFIQDWNYTLNEKSIDDKIITPLKSEETPPSILSNKDLGFCQAYTSSPLDEESIAENIFLSLLNNSYKTFYFTTPYLILSKSCIENLVLSAKSGIDIRIIIPGIPDKKIVYSITRSNINYLVKNGIKIYSYKKGFIHSKLVLSDSKIGIVGSVNIDYRSFYLNFENGIIIYKGKGIEQLQHSFQKMFQESKLEKYEKKSLWNLFSNIFLKLFIPLF